MVWGHSTPKVRLTYKALDEAIVAKGRRGRVGEVHVHASVWARRVTDTSIALKLHNTDIITFWADGTRTLRVCGWHTPLTHYWLNVARHRVSALRINRWTPKVWVLSQPSGPVAFFDEMRVDVHGVLIGEPKPITKRVPNAAAKALRKEMLQVYNEKYLPHLRFLDLDENWYATVKQWSTSKQSWGLYGSNYFTHDSIINPVHLLAAVLMHGTRMSRLASNVFKAYVDKTYVSEVLHKELFDVVPY